MVMSEETQNQSFEKQRALEYRARKAFEEALTAGKSLARACLDAGVSTKEGNEILVEMNAGKEHADTTLSKRLQESMGLAISRLEEIACNADEDKASVAACLGLIRLRLDLMRMETKKVKKPEEKNDGQKSLWEFG